MLDLNKSIELRKKAASIAISKGFTQMSKASFWTCPSSPEHTRGHWAGVH
jgi:hypothetical protein